MAGVLIVQRLVGEPVSVEVGAGDVIGKVRAEIAALLGMPISQLRLVCGTRVIDDLNLATDFLGEFGVTAIVVPSGVALVGTKDGCLKVFDLAATSGVRPLGGEFQDRHRDCIHAISADLVSSKKAVSASNDFTLRVWDLQRMCCLGSLVGHRGAVLAVGACFRHGKAVSGSVDRSLRVWDLEAMACLTILAQDDMCMCLSASFQIPAPLAPCAVSGGADSKLHIWNIEVAGHIGTLEGHQGAVLCVCTDFAQRRALSVSTDQCLCLWDLEARVCLFRRMVERMACHPGLLSADFSAQRALLVVGCSSLVVWDLSKLEKVREFVHPGTVQTFAADFKQQKALVAADSGALHVWDLESMICTELLEDAASADSIPSALCVDFSAVMC